MIVALPRPPQNTVTLMTFALRGHWGTSAQRSPQHVCFEEKLAQPKVGNEQQTMDRVTENFYIADPGRAMTMLNLDFNDRDGALQQTRSDFRGVVHALGFEIERTEQRSPD